MYGRANKVLVKSAVDFFRMPTRCSRSAVLTEKISDEQTHGTYSVELVYITTSIYYVQEILDNFVLGLVYITIL